MVQRQVAPTQNQLLAGDIESQGPKPPDCTSTQVLLLVCYSQADNNRDLEAVVRSRAHMVSIEGLPPPPPWGHRENSEVQDPLKKSHDKHICRSYERNLLHLLSSFQRTWRETIFNPKPPPGEVGSACPAPGGHRLNEMFKKWSLS